MAILFCILITSVWKKEKEDRDGKKEKNKKKWKKLKNKD